jgi:hypothetical protein
MARNPANDEAMVLVVSCGATQAEMIEEIFANNGIECALQGETAANTLPAAGELDEVRVWVKPSDALKARELVDEFYTPISGDLTDEDDSFDDEGSEPV